MPLARHFFSANTPERSTRLASLFRAGAMHVDEAIEYEQHSTDRDGRIRDVECRPMPAAVIDIDEIDDVAMQGAIDDVTECTTDNQGQRDRQELALPRRQAPQPGQHEYAHTGA